MTRRLRQTGALFVLSVALCLPHAGAADKQAAILLLQDGLTVPHESVLLAAKLVQKGLIQQGLGGEPLELLINGQVVATAMTGGDGQARFSYTPKAQAAVHLQVRLGNSPRVAPVEGQGNLLVWERRNPIVAIEMAALTEPPSQAPLPGFELTMGSAPTPMPDAADELGKLTQFYYHVIYMVSPGMTGNGFQAGVQARAWLETHKFPTGYVVVLQPGEQAVGAKIDELHAAGVEDGQNGHRSIQSVCRSLCATAVRRCDRAGAISG
jgi:hypothetical protein